MGYSPVVALKFTFMVENNGIDLCPGVMLDIQQSGENVRGYDVYPRILRIERYY